MFTITVHFGKDADCTHAVFYGVPARGPGEATSWGFSAGKALGLKVETVNVVRSR